MQDKELNIEDLTQGIVSFIKKNIVFLIGFLILGLILGFVRYQKAKPAYQTNVFAKSTFIPLDLVKNEVASVNALIEEGNYKQLSEDLNLDSTQVVKFSSVKFFNVSEDDKIFSVQIKSLGDANPNQAMVEGISAYLESNEFLSDYLATKSEQLSYNDEIYKQALANLLIVQEGIIIGGKASSYSLITDPGSLSDEIVKYQKLIKNNALLLDEVVPYRVIDSVNIVSSPSLKKSLLTTTIVILFLGSFFLITFRLFWTKS